MALTMTVAAALAAAALSPEPVQSATAIGDTAPPAAATTAEAPPPVPAPLLLPRGTMVRLMVLNEVNSRDHKAGHRFVLRVDEEVKAGQATVIPIGAKAWGEVVTAQGTGGVGKNGKLDAKLLYVEADGRRIALDGQRNAAGKGSAAQVVGAVVGFGIFGLLTKGNNATLKAGEIINGYTVDDVSFGSTAVAAAQ